MSQEHGRHKSLGEHQSTQAKHSNHYEGNHVAPSEPGHEHGGTLVGHIALTFVASVVITAQSSINAALNDHTKNPILSALLVFVAGLLTVSTVVAVQPSARSAFRVIPKLVRSRVIRRWQLLGGLSGATFVSMQSGLVAATGVAVFTVAAVAGQTAGALLVDRTGIGPAGHQPVTLRRLLAAVLGVVGVVISVSGKDVGQVAIGAVVATFAAGVLVSSQPALNGQVALRSGHPLAATLVNFMGGLAALSLIFLLQQAIAHTPWTAPPAPWVDPVIWLGGPFGVFFVMVAARMARALGVFVFTLTSVVGQLSGAILMDIFFPTAATDISVQLLAGIAITAIAVILASAKRR